ILDVEIADSISDAIMDYTWDIYEAYQIYNATYTFLNVSEGELPGYPFTDFNFGENITYQVIDTLAGHRKVLQIEDFNNLTNGYWVLKYGNSGTVSGSIEFWIRISNLSPEGNNFEITLFENETGIIPISINENGSWYFKNLYSGNSSYITDLPQFIPNYWHHIRIDYECSTGNYSGLSQNQWRFTVDGVSSSNLTLQFGFPPNDNVNYMDCLKISSGIMGDMNLYCDAIGYSNISTYYHIGDNKNQITLSHTYLKTIYDLQPPLALNEGIYRINLKVENDLLSEQQITLEVKNLAPIVSTPSKRYTGCPGYIDITTYSRDAIIDIETMEYEWKIDNQYSIIKQGTLSSTVSVFCNSSGVIKGHVLARDSSDLFDSQDFYIRVFIDSNGDGFSNEYEELFGINDTDYDGDNLPNFIESAYFGTDWNDRDSDDDGLWDGWDNSTGAGEFSIGTNMTNPDTDNDLLLDGFEWYGWNVTHIINEQKIERFYTSDPLNSDTDGDGIDDYYEYTNRTDPNLADTDGDSLTDFQEIVIYGSDPTNPDTDNDGLWDNMEIEESTYFDNSDSDGDGLQDGAEYENGLNPLLKDSDRDFLPDNEEIIKYHYNMEGRMNIRYHPYFYFPKRGIYSSINAQLSIVLTYGENCSTDKLADFQLVIRHEFGGIFSKEYHMHATERYVSEVIDLKKLIENQGKEYYGLYDAYVNFRNSTHGDLCCEEFSIDLTTTLAPTINDYDEDGILDGVETNLLVPGDSYNYYDDVVNLTADTNSTTYDVCQFEISDIGLINNADLWFSIISNETVSGSGNVVVKVIKKPIKFGDSDSLVLISTKTFSTNDDFLEFYSKNLFTRFSNQSYGKYEIIVDIYDTDTSDVFILTNLTIKINGYRQATYTDTDAWITRPDLSDSDDDGWSDKYEIYDRSEPTNPLAWDTDGDGIKDSADWDPLYDIVLEVRFIEGALSTISYDRAKILDNHHTDPKLQMVVLFKHQGEDGAYVSKPVTCSESTRYKEKLFYPTISFKSRANFDNLYYIDIEDDQVYYELEFELWDYMNYEPDFRYERKLLPGGFMFLNSGTKWQFNFHNYERNKEYQIESIYSRPKLKASVTTRALQHSNTIAVYQNETIFNGHYNVEDRYHVIQVNVVDTPSSESHFKNGVNTIVIPNKALMKSRLSSLLLNTSSLETSFLAYGHFMTIDRSELPAKASNTVETVFNIDLMWLDAENLLDLALTGIINDTTGEIGIINFCVSTNQNNTVVEMMNLPYDVLYVIPFITPFTPTKDHPDRMPIQGRHTTNSYGIVIDFFIKVFGVIFDVAAIAFEVIVEMVKIIADIFIKIIEVVIAFFAWIAEQAAKAALLVLIYTMHAIHLAISVAIIVLILGVFSIIKLLLDVTLDSGTNFIQVQGAINFSLEYEVGEKYNSYLEQNIPTIEASFSSNQFSFELTSYFFGNHIEITDFPEDFWDQLSLKNTFHPLSNRELPLSSNTDEAEKVYVIMDSFATTLEFCGLGFTGIAIALGARSIKQDAGASFLVATGFWFASLAAAISLSILMESELKAEASTGVGLALILSGVTALAL
ncbi:MAG: hypothetical protein ACFE9R_08020, partial [Candidatus Hermodarchaeota archaeon]